MAGGNSFYLSFFIYILLWKGRGGLNNEDHCFALPFVICNITFINSLQRYLQKKVSILISNPQTAKYLTIRTRKFVEGQQLNRSLKKISR